MIEDAKRLVQCGAMASLHAALVAEGFELQPRARMWVRPDGCPSARLVWHRRRDGQWVMQSLRLPPAMFWQDRRQ